MMSKPITRRLALTGAAGAAAAATGRPARSAPTKVRFLTSWFAEAEHGGFYQAKATGLYEKAGLDVDIHMGGPQVNGMQLLTGGAADIVMGYDIQVLKGIENGLPITTIGTSFQFDLQGVMAHDDIPDLAALKGHKILIAASSHQTFWPWLEAEIRLHRRDGRRRYLQPATLPGGQDDRHAGLPVLRAVRGSGRGREGEVLPVRR